MFANDYCFSLLTSDDKVLRPENSSATLSENAFQTPPDTSAEILTGAEYTEATPTLFLMLVSSSYTANSLSQFSLRGQTIGPGQTITVPPAK
jgi:hypothetical protein